MMNKPIEIVKMLLKTCNSRIYTREGLRRLKLSASDRRT